MLKVNVIKGNIDRALKQLKRKVRSTKQNEEIHNREEFIKKSTKKHEMRKKARYRQERRDEEYD